MDNIDPAELARDLLEDASAKLPSTKAEIRILPARGLDLHHDVVLISDHAPVYIGTIGPKHSVWRVIKTATNVGRGMRTQLHWHMPTKEECAIRMAEVMRPYWKPIINQHGVDGMFESTKAEIEVEAEKAEKPASDEQAEAGNYKKGHVSVQGLEIAIENAKGSTRSGVNKAGKSWSVTLPAHYGYIKGTVGKDKDHLDVYIGDNPGGMLVFVVNQKKEEGGFDEHKIMLGFSSKDEAIETYDRAFTGDLGPKLRESVVSTTMDKLKEWLASGNTKKPFESVAESIVDSLLGESDDPKELAMSIEPAPRFFGQLKVGQVTYDDETGAYHRVDKIHWGYQLANYQDENGKLVYDPGPSTLVYMTEFSPAYAYGRFTHTYPYNAKGALLAHQVVNVGSSDKALWALVDAEIDKNHGEGTAALAQAAEQERRQQPAYVAGERARAEIQRMLAGNGGDELVGDGE